MKRGLILCAFLLMVHLPSYGQVSSKAIFDQFITRDQLEEDTNLLKEGLEKLHPGLYEYTSKDSLDKLFENAYLIFENGMPFSEYYKELCTLIAHIKCQHTIAAPESSVIEDISNSGTFFPLWLKWEFEPFEAYVGADLSSDANLPPGLKIMSINDQSMLEIYQSLISYFPSDGDILTNKHSRLETGIEFQFWYYLLIDRPEVFRVKLMNDQGVVFEKTISAVTFKEWTKNHKKYRKSKNPMIRAYMDYHVSYDKHNTKNPIRLDIAEDDVAILKVGNFYSHKFSELMNEAFESLQTSKIDYLIVDVRNNEGGSDILGRELFSHFIDKPTVYFDSLYTSKGISDTTFVFNHTEKNKAWYEENLKLVFPLDDGRFATKPEVNKGLQVQQPQKIRFSGKVYILMNGRSASTTAEFTAAMHANQLATFIGEESGGDYHGGNGGDFATLRLPNSKIEINIPLVRYVMNSGIQKYYGRGTIPDYELRNTMQNFLHFKDAQLDFTLELIRNSKKE